MQNRKNILISLVSVVAGAFFYHVFFSYIFSWKMNLYQISQNHSFASALVTMLDSTKNVRPEGVRGYILCVLGDEFIRRKSEDERVKKIAGPSILFGKESKHVYMLLDRKTAELAEYLDDSNYNAESCDLDYGSPKYPDKLGRLMLSNKQN